MMHALCDALVIGAGPAGSAAAIWLAQAGWRVVLVEQHAFPRQKVCGECISAGSLMLLDDLGVGPAFRELAGPELRYVGWIGKSSTITADFPPCLEGDYRYGRAIGRGRLDKLILERARHVGVEVLQPARVCRVRGTRGNFICELRIRTPNRTKSAAEPDVLQTRQARIIVDAHGSWEAGPAPARYEGGAPSRAPKRNSDLFAFKASFRNSRLAPGFLPVIALEGGYGGIVVADQGRTTLACCIRRDRLRACRELMPGATAGTAVGALLHRSCRGVREALDQAKLESSWLSVGPIRPGIRLQIGLDTFRVGNAAGETHPLIGEGISMALQSANLLAGQLLKEPLDRLGSRRACDVNRRYAAAWRTAFVPRLRFAAGIAHAAMRPLCAAHIELCLHRWPSLLTEAARWAGKARRSIVRS